MMFYENKKITMYNVIGAVMYGIIDNYICHYFMGLFQERQSKHDNKFEKNKFNYLSGLGIPNILMNIMSCNGFDKSSILTVILTCRSDLVPHYLYKGFVIVEREEGGVDNITINTKMMIHDDDLHQ